MGSRKLWIGALATGLAVTAIAQVRDGAKSAGSGMYKVTSWPDHSADNRYAEEVEQHLNQMAAEGWRFHSELAGQGAKMMLFERAGR